MHRVLQIPEIVGLIFTFMEKKDNANNACVCKRWSAIALDTLWGDIDGGLHRLFGLLAPPVVHHEWQVGIADVTWMSADKTFSSRHSAAPSHQMTGRDSRDTQDVCVDYVSTKNMSHEITVPQSSTRSRGHARH